MHPSRDQFAGKGAPQADAGKNCCPTSYIRGRVGSRRRQKGRQPEECPETQRQERTWRPGTAGKRAAVGSPSGMNGPTGEQEAAQRSSTKSVSTPSSSQRSLLVRIGRQQRERQQPDPETAQHKRRASGSGERSQKSPQRLARVQTKRKRGTHGPIAGDRASETAQRGR